MPSLDVASSLVRRAFARRRLPSHAAAICAAALIAALPSASAPPSAAVAYVDRAGWVMTSSGPGTSPVRVVKGDYPSLSPDGTRLAYCTTRTFDAKEARSGALIVLHLASRAKTVVARPGAAVVEAAWSPAGDRIAFATIGGDGRRSLWTVAATGGATRQVRIAAGPAPVDLFEPVWDADGRGLVCHDLVTLYHVSIDGRDLGRTSLASIAGKPNVVTSSDRFGPKPGNATLMAFTMSMPGTRLWERELHEPCSTLMLRDSATGRRARVTPPGLMAVSPSWSRAGTWLYFYGYRDTQAREDYPMRIWRIRPDGSGLAMVGRGERVGP